MGNIHGISIASNFINVSAGEEFTLAYDIKRLVGASNSFIADIFAYDDNKNIIPAAPWLIMLTHIAES